MNSLFRNSNEITRKSPHRSVLMTVATDLGVNDAQTMRDKQVGEILPLGIAQVATEIDDMMTEIEEETTGIGEAMTGIEEVMIEIDVVMIENEIVEGMIGIVGQVEMVIGHLQEIEIKMKIQKMIVEEEGDEAVTMTIDGEVAIGIVPLINHNEEAEMMVDGDVVMGVATDVVMGLERHEQQKGAVHLPQLMIGMTTVQVIRRELEMMIMATLLREDRPEIEDNSVEYKMLSLIC